MYWSTICFDTGGNFAKHSYTVTYEGQQIEIISGTSTEGHNLHLGMPTDEYEVHYKVCCNFLSEIAWLFKQRVEVLATGGGGRKAKVNVVNRIFNRSRGIIDLNDYEQVAFNHEQKLALSLYREGISSNSNFYKFLSYFKIINIKYSSGTNQKQWINRNIHKVRHNDILQKIGKKSITNFGEHLYASGRCAIAHASMDSDNPIADPDNFHDNSRISTEIPLIKDLAEIFIRDELNVPDRF